MPTTAREVAGLERARSQMSEQLISARNRRNSIAARYEDATGANRSGLEQQLRLLDQRILQLESDIAQSGRMRTSPQVAMIPGMAPAERFANLDSGQITGISIVFILFVLFPVALSIGRSFWRRSSRPVTPPGWTDVPHRFDRLEQAVDAIAIEMERVSEGQRFMTRIITEGPDASERSSDADSAAQLNGQGQPLALGAGSPDQLLAARHEEEAIPVRRTYP